MQRNSKTSTSITLKNINLLMCRLISHWTRALLTAIYLCQTDGQWSTWHNAKVCSKQYTDNSCCVYLTSFKGLVSLSTQLQKSCLVFILVPSYANVGHLLTEVPDVVCACWKLIVLVLETPCQLFFAICIMESKYVVPQMEIGISI